MLQKIGRYQIVEELGRGAMGVVYKARDPVIGRFVAIKTVRLGDFSDAYQIEELKTRLVREAQAAGGLSHPNIITIFDVGEEDDLSYIAMELVEGVCLETLLDSKQVLEESTILHIARQVADALGYAHDHGIVHRDIKPANIMLTKDGHVKVADFGIAKVASSKMTQTGMLLGSPSYMAPEHFLGQPLDGRSDIFALGIVLYELITGQLPFVGQNLGVLSYKIVHEDVLPPRQLKPTVSEELDGLVLRALARDPAQRFQGAAELCAALDGILARLAAIAPAAAAVSDKEQSASVSRERTLAETLAVAAAPEKSGWRWLGFLFLALLLTGAVGLAFALASPRQFQQTLQWAKTQTQPWLNRLLRRSLSASLPVPPPPTNPAGDNHTSNSASAPLPSAGEPVRREIPPGWDNGGNNAPTRGSPRPPVNTQPPGGHASSSSAQTPAPLGILQVSSSPPGAQIVFDGEEGTAWVTPFTFRDVPAGRHTLDFKRPGYNTERRIVSLLGKETQRISVVLAATLGILRITTVPAGAQIYVDGELKPETTPATLKLATGAQRILLRKGGYKDAELLVEIEDNSVTTLNQQLLEVTP
jgi:eukaryotic-like serine/threonine-protein kinase